MKKKICSICKQEKYLWKSKPPTCQSCIQRKPINKVSEKQKNLLKEYKPLREDFLKKHPNCQLKLQDCLGIATDIHHTFSGKDKRKYFLETNTWKALCRNCHSKVHDVLTHKENLNLKMKNE